MTDNLFEEIAVSPHGYEPLPACVLTVCASFGCGGAQRQTVTVLSMLARDSRIKKLVAVAKSNNAPDDLFFLPKLRQIPIEPIFYGANLKRRTEIDPSGPLARTPRLRAIIESFPGDVREQIVRFSNILIRERPKAVHQRQDLYACALACAIVGVPTIVIHRGSLAPDRWGLGEAALAQWVRPLQNAYRNLLTLPGVQMVNITQCCSDSDRAWLGWPDTSRFRVVCNGVDFASLGANGDRNWELRRALGIGDRAFVVGGAFRLVPVKRPMFWMAVAERIAQALPDSHFVVIGDGPMKDEMRRHAEFHGFLDRLHLPGIVTNIGDWYRTLDLNLLTSSREGLANVLVEGQHFGVPVLAPDVGGISEAVLPGITGHLLPAQEGPDAFASMALRLWDDAAWRETARSAGPPFVHDKFGVEQALAPLIACYELE